MADTNSPFGISNAEAIREWSNIPHEAIEAFGEEGDFARQHLLNPALLSLLGDVAGKHILDAGCGQGYFCRLLARRGALVTGIEPAQNLYQYALIREQSEKLGITYLQHDLCSPALAQFYNTFDFVVANMVFMDIPDYRTAIQNCIATLKSNGELIFSLLHPCFEEPGSEWPKKGYVEVREYFQERAIPQSFAHLFHRPLSSYLNFIIQIGCVLQQVIEPQLDEQVARSSKNDRDVHVPSFIIIHARRGTYKPPTRNME